MLKIIEAPNNSGGKSPVIIQMSDSHNREAGGFGEEKGWEDEEHEDYTIKGQRKASIERAKKLKGQVRAIILPGNGGGDITEDCNWYAWLANKLEKEEGIPVILTNFPGIYTLLLILLLIERSSRIGHFLSTRCFITLTLL